VTQVAQPLLPRQLAPSDLAITYQRWASPAWGDVVRAACR